MNVSEYYRGVLNRRVNLLEECLADSASFAVHVISHNALKDFDLLLDVIGESERPIFLQACREYQYSLEAVLYGNYRHAFASLRLSFELFTASIYFSAHQMKRNLWLLGSDDLNWSALVDPDKGVYSHNFIKAFNPELGTYRTQYSTLSTQVYRECSEYVHGNPGTHEDLTLSIEFNAEKFSKFHDKATTVRLCILFQFFARYLLEMSSGNKARLEPLAMDAFGTLPEIQASFGATSK